MNDEYFRGVDAKVQIFLKAKREIRGLPARYQTFSYKANTEQWVINVLTVSFLTVTAL